jgi:hypothetical protein
LAKGSSLGFSFIAWLTKNFSPRVLRSAGPRPKSWLTDGPPVPALGGVGLNRHRHRRGAARREADLALGVQQNWP